MIQGLARQLRASSRLLRASADLLEGYGAMRLFRQAPGQIDAAYDFLGRFAYGDVRPMPFQIRDEIRRTSPARRRASA